MHIEWCLKDIGNKFYLIHLKWELHFTRFSFAKNSQEMQVARPQ